MLRQRDTPFGQEGGLGFPCHAVPKHGRPQFRIQRVADVANHRVVRPNAERLFGVLFQLFHIFGGLHRGNYGLPFPLFDVLIADERKGRGRLSLLIHPPAGRKNLVRQVGIERAGDVGDAFSMVVNKLNRSLNIPDCPGHKKGAVGMAKIYLHINDDQMHIVLVFGRWFQVGLCRVAGDGGYVGVEEGTDALRVVKAGEVAHGFGSPCGFRM